MDVRTAEILVVDGLLIAQAAGYAYIFWKQRKIIKLQKRAMDAQQEAVNDAGEAVARLKALFESKMEESDILSNVKSGQFAIGVTYREGKHFAVIEYPSGESFRGPSRETEEEALVDVMKKKDEILEALGPRVKLVHGPGVGPVH